MSKKTVQRQSRTSEPTEVGGVSLDLDVLIITAADGEDEAVRLVDADGLSAWHETPGPDGFGFAVWRRDFQTPTGRTMRVGLTKAASMGVEASLYAASWLVPIHKPWCLAMCGVCAGRPSWANLGDVIVAEWLYRYDVGDHMTTADGKPIFRPDAPTYNLRPQWKQLAERYRPSVEATWIHERPIPSEHQELWLLKALLDDNDPQESDERDKRCRDWTRTVERLEYEKHIKLQGSKIMLTSAGRKHIEEALVRCNGLPEPELWKVVVGPLGTGACLQRDLAIWDRISDYQRRVVGLEMEAAAIGRAAELLEVERMIVIKGVMDHAEPDRPQSFRAFAARAAAEVLIGFLRERFDEEGPSGPRLIVPNIWTAPADAQNPGTLLNARYEIVPFSDEPRARELGELTRWCDDPNGPCVRLFIGPGGAGKTRLLIEFSKRLRAQGWDAGFLVETVPDGSGRPRAVHGGDVGTLLAGPRPTLIVVDYAESRTDLLEFLKRVASTVVEANPAVSAARFRVALLARNAGDWFESLKQQDAGAKALLEAAVPLRFDPVPLDGPLRAKVHAQASAEFSRRLKGSGNVGENEGWRGLKPAARLSDPHFERVLYLHAAALLDVLGIPAEPDSILAEVLGHERRLWSKRYREQHADDPLDAAEFTTRASRTVAALTLCGGAKSREAAEKINERVAGPKEKHFIRFLHGVYPGSLDDPSVRRYLAGLEPDLLGETLVRAVLFDSNTPSGFLAKATADAEFEELRTAFTVLGRVALRAETNGNGWLAALLDEDVLGRCIPALLATLALSEETAHSRLGQLLADRLPPAARAGPLCRIVEALVPHHTVSLRELGAWALDVGSAGTDEASLAERARNLNNRGVRLGDLGRREEALEATREAVEKYRTLAAARPDAFLPDLAASLNNLGIRLSELGRREEALKATREAVEICRTLAAARPDAFLPDLAMSLNNLGAMLSELGRREEALEATREAVEIRRTLAAARPDAFLPNLAASLNNLGIRLSELGRREEALEATREAVEIRRTLAAARPDAFLPDLAMSLNNLGNRLSELGRREEALEATREAVELSIPLVRKHPAAFLERFRVSMGNLVKRLEMAGRDVDADPTIAECMRLLQELRIEP